MSAKQTTVSSSYTASPGAPTDLRNALVGEWRPPGVSPLYILSLTVVAGVVLLLAWAQLVAEPDLRGASVPASAWDLRASALRCSWRLLW
jgi:hypothetical protein